MTFTDTERLTYLSYYPNCVFSSVGLWESNSCGKGPWVSLREALDAQLTIIVETESMADFDFNSDNDGALGQESASLGFREWLVAKKTERSGMAS